MPKRKEFFDLLIAHSDRVVASANATQRLTIWLFFACLPDATCAACLTWFPPACMGAERTMRTIPDRPTSSTILHSAQPVAHDHY